MLNTLPRCCLFLAMFSDSRRRSMVIAAALWRLMCASLVYAAAQGLTLPKEPQPDCLLAVYSQYAHTLAALSPRGARASQVPQWLDWHHFRGVSLGVQHGHPELVIVVAYKLAPSLRSPIGSHASSKCQVGSYALPGVKLGKIVCQRWEKRIFKVTRWDERQWIPAQSHSSASVGRRAANGTTSTGTEILQTGPRACRFIIFKHRECIPVITGGRAPGAPGRGPAL